MAKRQGSTEVKPASVSAETKALNNAISQIEKTFGAGDEAIVEWRALTVALLDRIAQHVRQHLGLDAARLPLVKVLEAGTWFAGRALAAERRPGGGPPIAVASDGTVF